MNHIPYLSSAVFYRHFRPEFLSLLKSKKILIKTTTEEGEKEVPCPPLSPDALR
jgi:hypothetical protein